MQKVGNCLAARIGGGLDRLVFGLDGPFQLGDLILAGFDHQAQHVEIIGQRAQLAERHPIVIRTARLGRDIIAGAVIEPAADRLVLRDRGKRLERTEEGRIIDLAGHDQAHGRADPGEDAGGLDGLVDLVAHMKISACAVPLSSSR